jgi:DNA topoisomerase VI subunit A
VDGDPDGLEILSTYKFGSKTQAKLNQDSLGVDRIEWLGVKGTEWSRSALTSLDVPVH